jgi:hypothetical protein
MHLLFRLGSWSSRILWRAGLETILELSGDAFHVTHTSGTSCLSPLCLLAPIVCNVALAIDPFHRVPLKVRGSDLRDLGERTLSDLSSRVTA